MENADRLRHARSLWKNTGQRRPSFAVKPKEGQESVWDYPRPPAIVEDSREVIVRCGEVVIAHTNRSLRICETASPPTFYLPPEDVATEQLKKSSNRSFCEWKGQATYWSSAIPDQPPQSDIGWTYEEPFGEFEAIRGYFAFYPARAECLVDGHVALPQAGGFYGGWITPELVGPFKGESGTSAW